MSVAVLNQSGGNLIDAVERVRQALQAQSAYLQKLNALTGQTRATANILALLPGGFLGMTAVLSKEYINLLLGTRPGNIMLAVLIGLWISGMIWIRAMMRVRA